MDPNFNLIAKDLKHVWHPCTQMKDLEQFKPLVVSSAQGSYINLADGRQLIDAISSWWSKSLGHNHPYLKQALLSQCNQFEHVIAANTTHTGIASLSEKLAQLTINLDKVFYASDGSCAIEIAMKMSMHAHHVQGETQRHRFMSLQNSYHGETGLALSVSDLGIYRQVYQPLLIETFFLNQIPYVQNRNEPLWHDCSEIWPNIEKQLSAHAHHLTAILIEPIAQGAGGMQIYSADFLKKLRQWTIKHNIHLIADEIMTGIGRTGYALACQHAQIEPDFLCLGKGLTSGWLPLSVMLTSSDIYNLFYADYEQGKNFLHSHTHSGNALAVSVALACLNVMETENIYQKVRANENLMRELMQEIADQTGKLSNVRNIGAIVAADLMTEKPRLGLAVSQTAIELGALLRPLGNTVYWLPPLNIEKETLIALQKITLQAINKNINLF